MSGRIFCISDTHFGHQSLLDRLEGVDGKPMRGQFANTEEMDEFIIDNWNAAVRPQDHVWHLGDVAMRKPYLQKVKKLHGHKTLIGGNHDIFDTKDYLRAGFKDVRAIRVWERLIFSHIPLHPSSLHRFLANVHGHLHDKPTPGPGFVNVSCEVVGYTPVPVDTILATVTRLRADEEEEISAPLRTTLGSYLSI